MIDSNNNSGSTQPSKAAKKNNPKRGRTFLLYALILIVILVLAIFSGYRSGIGIRRDTRAQAINQQIGEQFQNTLVDIEFGRYEIAKQRLEWIIENDPNFPGAQEKLTEVLVQINLQENYVPPTATPAPTSTPDFSGVQEAFSHAQQLIAAQDWPGALSALDESRKLDPNYETSKVDGMYYFALRNRGYDLITKEGNLEGGIYYITLAERFGILDVNANGVREGARYYILGASFWELNWEQTLFYFNQVYGGWPSLWDGTMTATDRFRIASMRYGDEFFGQDKFCDAVVQYENSQSIGPLDDLAQQNYNKAYVKCFPPTATFDPSSLFTPTIDPNLPTNTTSRDQRIRLFRQRKHRYQRYQLHDTSPSWALALTYWLHLLATVTWIGSIVAISILFLPAAKATLKPIDHLALIDAMQKRLEPIAWFSMTLLLLTGLFQMSVNPHYDGFVSTSTQWSTAILIKHILGIFMVVAAAIQTWEVFPAIRRTLMNKNNADEEKVLQLQKRERRLLRINFGLSLLILLATAFARAS